MHPIQRIFVYSKILTQNLMQKQLYIYIFISLIWSACHQATEKPSPVQVAYISKNVSQNVAHTELDIEKKGNPNAKKEKPDSIHGFYYPWYTRLKSKNMLFNRIATPAGYKRVAVEENSFGDWLRHLPMKSAFSKVYYYNDELKETQSIHEAVLDIDIGYKDLQKSEDAILRLYMEYLFSKKEYGKITFLPSPVDTFSFLKESENTDYLSFRKYLNQLYRLSTPYSLLENMNYAEVNDLKIGQVFVQPDEPGHAVIIVDVAENKIGQRIFLLAQAFSPAQDIHILKNFHHETPLSPWYPANFGLSLYTPEWEFTASDLMEFSE